MSFIRKTLVSGVVLAMATIPLIASCTYCGCSVDPITHTPQKPGQWTLNLGIDYADQNKPFIASDAAVTGQLSHHHDEQQTLTKRYSIGITHHLSETLQLGLELPLISRYHRHIHNHHGDKLFQEWQLGGLGDMWFQAQYLLLSDQERKVYLLAGIKLPTGGTRLTNTIGDEAEVGIQPGSGSYDTKWGVSYHDHIILPLNTSIIYTTNGNGTDGWKNGDQCAANLGTSIQCLPSLAISVQCNVLVIDKSLPGQTGEDVSTTGGTYLYLTPGIEYTLTDNTILTTQVQIPIYRYVNDIQLTADLAMRAGIQMTL